MTASDVRRRSTPTALDLAREQLRCGHTQAAADLCRRLAEHPDSAAGAQHLLGLIAFSRGAHDDAIRHLEAARAADPDRADHHYDLGVVHAVRGALDDARDCYRQAIALDPDHAEAHTNLGAMLLEQGQGAEAAECFAQALRVAPAHPAANLNQGSALLALGRIDEAIERLRQALELAPADPAAPFNLGNALRAAGDLNAAAECYRQSLALAPQQARAHYALAEIMHEQGHTQQAEAGYRQAIALAPGLLAAHANLAVLLREQDRLSEAAVCLRQALQLAPEDAQLQRLLRITENRALPAWHFPMLADEVRNDAYRRAIEQRVRPGCRVLDIGTGSGLLAMMAARAGAGSVLACEASPTIAATATQIVADNGMTDRIQVVAKRSTALTAGKDLPEPADVIVSEIVDVGLLGEGVVPSMRHALRELAAPGVVSIPAAARVFAQLVALPELRRAHPVGTVSGFDLGAFNRFQAADEYLDIQLAHHRHQPLSRVTEVLAVDFLAPWPHIPDAAPQVTTIAFNTIDDGTAHAVAFWFELELAPGITLCNRPGGELIAWGQAVQFLDADVRLHAGRCIDVRVLHSDTRIAFEIAPPPG